MILVTGGAGFIGANFVLDWLATHDEPVVNLDKLTYAGNLGNLTTLAQDARHVFVRGDIGDRALVERAAGATSPARHRELRGRVPRRPLHPRTRGVHRDERRGHVQPARGDACLVGRAAARRAGCLPLPARVDRRGLRFAVRHGSRVQRNAPPTHPTARTRRPRQLRITWCARTTTRTDCRRSRRIARTITVRASFRRSSSR